MNRELWESNIENSFVDPQSYHALSEAEKSDGFAGILSFGTAGIRGRVGLGPNRLNRFTVEKTALGIVNTLAVLSEPSVVIGYDTRHLSPEFSKAMASVISQHGVSVKLTKQYTSTPELSFFVREYAASLGIMITASHNPPEYNGIKVYGPDGAQLTDESAALLSENINGIEDLFSIESKPFDAAVADESVSFVSKEMEQRYKDCITGFIGDIPRSDLSVVFSSLHGTSVPAVPELFDALGFGRYTLVEDQSAPDGDFPTIISPNPESPEAFDLSKALGENIGADLLIATDPDADRVGIVVRHNGEYVHLNGNQIGILLLKERIQSTPQDKTPVVIKSIVTSDLGRKIAKDYGGELIEVLTGFKYIGEQIELLEADAERRFIFGYEESYGYLLEPFVRDKDAIQIVPYITSMASRLKKEDRTLVDALEEIYNRYGRRMEKLYSHTFEGTSGEERIKEIMSQFRNNTPSEIEKREVICTEDFKTQTRTFQDGRTETIQLPEADVIKIHFRDGWIALRPSGTEPKIKLYVSLDSDQIEQEAKLINDMIFSG